jgi:uncharacterized membrane protein YagU involved in acid resistance
MEMFPTVCWALKFIFDTSHMGTLAFVKMGKEVNVKLGQKKRNFILTPHANFDDLLMKINNVASISFSPSTLSFW